MAVLKGKTTFKDIASELQKDDRIEDIQLHDRVSKLRGTFLYEDDERVVIEFQPDQLSAYIFDDDFGNTVLYQNTQDPDRKQIDDAQYSTANIPRPSSCYVPRKDRAEKTAEDLLSHLEDRDL